MGPDLELRGKSETAMEASAGKENGSVSKDPEDKIMRCASNYEDNTFDIDDLPDEQTTAPDGAEDVELNIIECTNSSSIGLVQAECQDETENSSSFGDTVSGIENGLTLSDAEVDSRLCGDNTSASIFDGCGEVFRMRKKKLTGHWRRFIHPLMWRCKWVELKIKEFQSQALKYDRELAEYDRKKQSELEKFTLEGFGAKSLPFSSQNRRKKVMKRKKRKRIEDTVDIASFMSHHNLFSYYENKMSLVDGAFKDDCGNLVISTDKNINGNDEFGVNDEWPALKFRDGDNSLEQILWKIEVVQSQVHKLKTRVDKVVSENVGRFPSTDNLSLLLPCDALTSSARNPAASSDNGDGMPVGSLYPASRHISEYNRGDLVMSEGAVLSHGEVTPLPDIIESTDQRWVRGSCEDTGHGILLHNQVVKEELHNFETVKFQPSEKPQVPREEQGSAIPPVVVSGPDLPTETSVPPEQSTLKSRTTSKSNVPKSKRKRGRRKAGLGRWSRRSSC